MPSKPRDPQNPPEVGCAWIVVAMALFCWGMLTWSGIFGWSVTGRAKPISIYYSSGWSYYVGLPLGMTILSAVQLLGLIVSRRFAWIVVGLSGLSIVGLAPYVLMYASGT